MQSFTVSILGQQCHTAGSNDHSDHEEPLFHTYCNALPLRYVNSPNGPDTHATSAMWPHYHMITLLTELIFSLFTSWSDTIHHLQQSSQLPATCSRGFRYNFGLDITTVHAGTSERYMLFQISVMVQTYWLYFQVSLQPTLALPFLSICT
jgi:hypothetical protein